MIRNVDIVEMFMRCRDETYLIILITGVAGREGLFTRRRCRCLEAAQSRCSSSSHTSR
jgi:hypothetical protein